MKTLKRYIYTLIFVFFSMAGLAQMTGPSDPYGDPEEGGDPPLGAPIGSGLTFMIVASIVYGGKKVYDLVKDEETG